MLDIDLSKGVVRKDARDLFVDVLYSDRGFEFCDLLVDALKQTKTWDKAVAMLKEVNGN